MFKFISMIILSFIPGIFGRIWSPSGSINGWYNTLIKTPLTPDGWVFGTVWPILYFILGIALYLIIKSDATKSNKKTALILFGIHMLLNASWSFIFFGAHLITFGVINIIALITCAIIMQLKFKAINKYAGYLILPYIVWLTFALYLNAGIMFLN